MVGIPVVGSLEPGSPEQRGCMEGAGQSSSLTRTITWKTMRVHLLMPECQISPTESFSHISLSLSI